MLREVTLRGVVLVLAVGIMASWAPAVVAQEAADQSSEDSVVIQADDGVSADPSVIPMENEVSEDSAITPVDVPEPEYIQGTVVEVLEEEDVELNGRVQKVQKLKVEVTKGSIAGDTIEIDVGGTQAIQVVTYSEGDDVLVSYTKGLDGSDVFYITDFVRTDGLVFLFVLFVVVSLVIGGKKGFYSLVSMSASFAILFLVVLPKIQDGSDPVVIAIIASAVIIPVTFYLSHGFEKKTTVAITGTFIALIATGLLSAAFVHVTHLYGASSEDALFLQSLGDVQYNMRGLLLAGIVIGALGVMDDITVSQTAIVYQLYDVDPGMPLVELFRRSIKIGKDHIASMINTLVLVYTGASLPLLLLFMNNPRPFGQLLSFEIIATEVVRTLVGSIGLMLAVPVTTFLACYFVRRSK